MPRPKNPDAPEPKKRSRNGCWPCKNKKVKCGEEKPNCMNCEKQGVSCDYSIRLNWEGRVKRKHENEEMGTSAFKIESPSLPDVKRSRSHEPMERRPPHVKSQSQDFYHYPSPQTSNTTPSAGENASAGSSQLGLDAQSQYTRQMLPPLTTFTSSPSVGQGYGHRPTTSTNSMATTGGAQSPYESTNFQLPGMSAFSTVTWKSPSPSTSRLAVGSPMLEDMPNTPSASSATSNEQPMHSTVNFAASMGRSTGDARRSSVYSLLSSPIKEDFDPFNNANKTQFTAHLNINYRPSSSSNRSYGVDRGMPDLDIPKNDDQHAIDAITPMNYNVRGRTKSEIARLAIFGFGLYSNSALPRGGYYYSSPREVTIPDMFEPLPPILTQNPMNLMYFHHFLNHTASILVPHDCSENPFRTILPQMALNDENLMHLLLAYSASHRARLLEHPEPANRIAVWVRDVFPTLRLALNDTASRMSNSNLAAAIMLASLEIVSPQTFEVPISWQNHLNVARQMVLARGGPQSVYPKDKVSYFLTRWFAYLDVLGSLSGSNNDKPLFSGDYWTLDDDFAGEDLQIDCVLGFTSQLVGILAKIAELARQCDRERIDGNGNIDPAWQPSMVVVADAERLKTQLNMARSHNFKGCPHQRTDSVFENAWDTIEMEATNEAFHYAGLIHLNRRVLGMPPDHYEVQDAVMHIVSALQNVRQGSTAEACLLFPMFTAGCEAKDETQREVILERIRTVEGSGMTQVRSARTLMELAWKLDKPWETLVQGEFFG